MVALIFVLLLLATPAVAQTNLTVAWRICEQHSKIIGKPTPMGPARMVFNPGYESCEAIQKLIPEMKPEAIDPNKAITDQMLIVRGIQDPGGEPK